MAKTKAKRRVDRAPVNRIRDMAAPSMPDSDIYRAASLEPLQPDFEVAPLEEIEAAAAWQRNKRVTALWGVSQNRNSWVLIDGVGWKKLSTTSDSATLALTVLASSGKLTQTRVDYREEPDGVIHELYVW